MAKSDQSGGAKPGQSTRVFLTDQQTVAHLKGALGIPGKVGKQMTVGHLAKPLGANPGSGRSQSGPAPKPGTPNQGSQGGGKK
jgi:hypothetical protein